MKSKKFVLAGLALLAITGLLALAGCKNDTVPETPAAKLVSISVTPPERTVYSERQSFDPTGMVVTATYNAGEPKDVTSLATTNFDTVAAGKGLGKEVTVSYTEGETIKTTTFTVTVFPAEVEVLTDYESPNNTGNDCTYVAFGEWPQSEAPGVNPTLLDPQPKNLFKDKYYFDANGRYVAEGGKYYKVEPIVWRVLTTNYTAPPEGGTVGEILLLAESILTGGIPYYHFDWEGGLDGKEWSGSRIIGNKTIHPNNYEHSQIRAWLNGLSYQSKESEGATQSPKDEYKNAGFLQTAFTESARNLIADTTVDNTAASTTDAGSNLPPATDYACANTTDKVFLLSEEEATTSDYGFATYSEYGKGNTRIRVTTDYAKATEANQGFTEGDGGWWWLRSPYYIYEYIARDIDLNGNADYDSYVNNANGGVVPALSISLQ